MNAVDHKALVAELVTKVQEGDQASFDQLFAETHRLARKVAYAIVGPELVEDAVQESYILVFQKIRQLDQPAAFLGWLSRLVMHVCYRVKRKHPEETSLPEHDLQTPDPTKSALTTIHLRQALDRLHKDDREILVLRELLTLSYEEVAYALAMPVGTVKSRLNTARKRLKERLELYPRA